MLRRARVPGRVMRPGAAALLALGLVLAGAAPARAEEGLDRVRFLLATDQPPSPAALARAVEDPVAALSSVALDAAERMLLRRRAIIALGHLDDRRIEPMLADLASTAPEGELRRAAAVAMSRLLGASAPERLVRRLASMLRHQDPADREVAVSLLARVHTAEAAEALADHRVVERHRAVVDALRRALQREAR